MVKEKGRLKILSSALALALARVYDVVEFRRTWYFEMPIRLI